MKKTLKLADIAEINIFSLLWKALLQWKVMLPFAIIVGILLSSSVYILSYLEFNSSKSLSTEDELYYVSNLTASEQSDVMTACNIYESLLEDTEYMENSILLSLNPYKLNSYNVYYFVSSNSANLYKTFLSGDAVSGLIGEIIAPNVPLNYTKELISVDLSESSPTTPNTSDGTIIKYSVILPGVVDTTRILSTLDSQLGVFSTQVSATVGAYTFNRIMAEQSIYSDTELAMKRQLLLQNIAGCNKNIQEYLDSFSRIQKGYYKYNLSKHPSTLNAEVSLDDSPKEPNFSVMYFLIGIGAGLIIYILYLLFQCLRLPSISTSFELENSIGIKNFGEIREYHTEGGFASLKNDRLLFQLKYKNVINTAKQIRQISDNIYTYFKNENIGEASLVAINTLIDKNEEYLEEIIHTSDESYIILHDAVSVEEGIIPKIKENDKIILILISGKTRYRDIGRLLITCKEHNATIIGSILLDC